ncbi:hypothetical protein, partial [Xanthomonas perforans]|uniref:hypothetical protein n=1 Tax=Xanthomonas perforans TaxID=442694 RepID=UPI001F466227
RGKRALPGSLDTPMLRIGQTGGWVDVAKCIFSRGQTRQRLGVVCAVSQVLPVFQCYSRGQ